LFLLNLILYFCQKLNRSIINIIVDKNNVIMSEALALPRIQNVAVKTPKYITLEAYFKAEEKSLTKNEYHDGIIIPMAGAKLRHNRLAHRAAHLIEIFNEEKELDYIVSNSDTKIRIEDFNKVVYPDAVVVCPPPQYYNGREDTITNPLVVVEVLSTSTKKFDQGTKFEMYRSLPSFKEYVLVYQDLHRVAVWTKQNDGSWLPKDYIGDEAVAILHALEGCPLPLKRLYRGL
jgi:Uma2 family endonuclease